MTERQKREKLHAEIRQFAESLTLDKRIDCMQCGLREATTFNEWSGAVCDFCREEIR